MDSDLFGVWHFALLAVFKCFFLFLWFNDDIYCFLHRLHHIIIMHAGKFYIYAMAIYCDTRLCALSFGTPNFLGAPLDHAHARFFFLDGMLLWALANPSCILILQSIA